MTQSIYVSSTVLAGRSITTTLDELKANGVTHVEWSGGHPAESDGLEAIVQADQHGLKSRLHNYFPPPEEDFVLNLASADQDIARRSFEHVERALQLTSELDATRYGVHAGLCFDPRPSEMGRPFSKQRLLHLDDRRHAIERFIGRYLKLQELADRLGVNLYVENNVLSESNARTFEGLKPLMLLDTADWIELHAAGVRNLLLDLAHLQVTCNSLGKDYDSEAEKLFNMSDYIHVSETNGKADTNDPVKNWQGVLRPLRNLCWGAKTLTVEVYSSLQETIESRKVLAVHLDQGEL